MNNKERDKQDRAIIGLMFTVFTMGLCAGAMLVVILHGFLNK